MVLHGKTSKTSKTKLNQTKKTCLVENTFQLGSGQLKSAALDSLLSS